MPNTKTDQADLFEKRESVERTRAVSGEAIRSAIRADEATVARDGDRDVTMAAQAWGRPFSGPEFRRKLKTLNPKFWFEQSESDPRQNAVYIIRREPDSYGFMRTVRRHVCGMEHEFMPEYSYVDPASKTMPDPDIVGHNQTIQSLQGGRMFRGWRTVLSILIRAGHITQTQADQAFGTPDGRSAKLQERLGQTL